MDKLKRIPEPLWLLFLAIGLCLRDLYVNLTFDLVGYLQYMGLDTVGMTEGVINSAHAVEIVFGALVYTVIFELIARFFYTLQIRRGLLAVSKMDYLFELRYYYILACLLNALISLIYLAIPQYVRFIDGPIRFAVTSVTLALFYFVTAKRFVPHGKMTKNYLLQWAIYFGFHFVVNLIGLIIALRDRADVDAVISAGVLLGNCIFVGLVTLLPMVFFKKGDLEPEPAGSTNGSVNDNNGGETFIGLGF